MKVLQPFPLALLFAFFSCQVFAATVNINTADAAAIDAAMQGVGPKTAAAIVAYRGKHGPFKTVDELVKVKGIGQKAVEKNRANLTAGESRP
jgi:competence protein ComEA